MFASRPYDELAVPIEPMRVLIVVPTPTAITQTIVEALQREALPAQPVTQDVLDRPPSAPVYVVSMAASAIAELAPRFVTWSAGSALRAGLIGLVHDGRTEDREELLAIGFDDAVPATVSTRELIARIRAVHRRVHWKGSSNGRLRFSDLTLDLYGRELWIDGKTIPLTSIELAVVRELIKARGKPLSRAELLDLAWGEGDLEVSERAVDNVILRLRRKLPRPDLIETVRSVGFRISTP
ncbi:MAG TPA: response regulator transcription factor [Kofleriaceae bacterium]|nr:response regulator transcription factor [Kofleriaceae bacterium]